MSGNLMKLPVMQKRVTLPEDSPIGYRVELAIGEMHGIHWTAYWTVLNTAKCELELKCHETGLCPWEFVADVEVCFKGGPLAPKTVRSRLCFSQRLTCVKLEQIEEGRKYKEMDLKITRKSTHGLPILTYVDFDKKSRWLDVLIRNEDGTRYLYANSGVLALNSPLLRRQLEEETMEIVLATELFPAMHQILNFLHPPFIFHRPMSDIEMEKSLDLVTKWEMEAVRNKYENVLLNSDDAFSNAHKYIRLAEKFHLRKLLEEVLWSIVGSEILYTLVKEHAYSPWVRSAVFHVLMDEADTATSEGTQQDETVDDEAFGRRIPILAWFDEYDSDY